MPTTTPKKTPARRGRPAGATARKPRAAKPTAPIHAAKPAVLESVSEAKPAHKPMAKTGHGHNFYAVGKRKTSVAQIVLAEGNGSININKLPFEGYFMTTDLQHIVQQPLASLGVEKQIDVKAKIHGGGIHSQAEALRHALSRALIQYNPESRSVLKKQGFLTRDPRVKERKKPGLKRARRAPQFSKR